MANKDKTADKLLASMRKSKAGAVSEKNARAQDSTASKAEASAGGKSSRSDKRAKSQPRKTQSKSSVSANGFVHGRRVWPD